MVDSSGPHIKIPELVPLLPEAVEAAQLSAEEARFGGDGGSKGSPLERPRPVGALSRGRHHPGTPMGPQLSTVQPRRRREQKTLQKRRS